MKWFDWVSFSVNSGIAQTQNHSPWTFKNVSLSPKASQTPSWDSWKSAPLPKSSHSLSTFPEVYCLLDDVRFRFHWHAEWTLYILVGPSDQAPKSWLGPFAWTCVTVLSLGLRKHLTMQPWTRCTDDLFFWKERRPALLCKQRKLTRSHSWAFLLFVSGNPPLQNSEPHMAVCFIFFILNLCLLLGMKCEILPRLCIFCVSPSQQSGGAGLKMFAHPKNNSSTQGQIRAATYQWEEVPHKNGCREKHWFLSYTTYVVAS